MQFIKHCVIATFVGAILLNAPILFADDSSNYDLYTSKLRYEEAAQQASRHSTLERWLLGFPTLPIDLLRAGLDPTAQYVEETHLVKKVDWAWKKIKTYGLHPEARFTPNGSSTGIGLQIRGDELFKTNEKIPNLQYDITGGWATDGRNGSFTDFAGGYTVTLPDNPKWYQSTRVRYDYMPLLNFFGIGHNTSLGDRSLYSQEEFQIDVRGGYKATPAIKIEDFFKYRHVNIGNGHMEEEFRFKERYDASNIPGFHGSDLINLGLALSHDNRDMEEDPLQGGYEKLQLYFAGDVRGENLHYMNLDFNAAHFFQMWSDRRIFALKFYAGRSQPLNGGEVPFFDLQRLGGYGVQPTGSGTLRSFRYNRFFGQTAFTFTPEYRYNIWKYGNFSADSVFFVDVGEVAKEIHSLGLDKLKVSYGTGIQVKHSRDVFFSAEIAFGNEGNQIYVRTKAPF